jgi:protein-L-isoaspartate(D-aspartate) O-methyltransferase
MDSVAPQTPESDWIAQVATWVSEAGVLNEDVETHVRNAFSRVPRAPFVDEQQRRFALGDIDLPIAHGQRLYRPSLLIRMVSLINLQKRMRILVLGAGSGYLCAVLSAAGAQVFGVEAIGALAQGSRKLLDSLGHHGVVVQRGDGNRGWEEAGPFDAIIVTYPVVNELDLPLGQLRVSGALVAPVSSEGVSRLTLWRRSSESYKRMVFEKIDVD